MAFSADSDDGGHIEPVCDGDMNADEYEDSHAMEQGNAQKFKQQMQRFNYAPSSTTNHTSMDADAQNESNASTPSRRSFRKRSAPGDNGILKASPSPSSAKKARKSSKYAPPSKYAHLPMLQDILEPSLICVFVGTNPGIRTATAGHAYAHPSNLFWKLLHSSGCTDVRLLPSQDVDLPRLYCMGNTNIVERPSKDAAELSKQEMAEGTPILEEKFRNYRPEAVCIVGKGIWEAVWRWRYKREIKKDEFRWGWQDEKENMGKTDEWEGAKVFVSSSTSGLSASLRPHEKEAIWKPFGEWVQSRRKARFGVEGRLPNS